MTTAEPRPGPAGPAPAVRYLKAVPQVVAVVLLALLPVGVAGFAGTEVNAMVVTLACLLGVQATMTEGPRWGAVLVAVGVGSMSVATVLSPHPWAAAAWIAVVGAGSYPAARLGRMRGYAIVGITTGFVVVAPVPVDPADKVELVRVVQTGGGVVLLNLVVGLLAGLWSSQVTARALPRSVPLPGLERSSAAVLAGTLAVTTATATFVVLEWYRLPLAAWLLLTLYVLAMSARPEEPRRAVRIKAAQRAVGTVGGALIAMVVALVVPWEGVQHLLGMGCLVVSLLLFLDPDPHHYWRAVALLTPAVVLFDSDAGTALSADAYRVGFTLLGVALAALVVPVVTVVLTVLTGRASGRSAPARP
ncbi:FUSC family protein [Rhabdothermincola salaria]|uniref:FUSC family protein n=1 Tax=Rhabdothermincola salaria TaxID=2903142 RepID=UPI001E4C101E|nr:FUSC family protein [Rhabdothermincola salaria]MCD9624345.1 hypothetical protein [Rhabdothermincola salaria]